MTDLPSDWNTLADLLTEKGHSREDVFSLLALIDAPPELIAFRKIATNLVSVLSIFETIISHDEYLSGEIKEKLSEIPQWLAICKAIATDPRSCINWIPEFDKQPTTPDSAPLTNLFRTHGIYVTLWYSSPSKEQNDRFTILIAQILLADMHLKLLEREGGIYENSKYRAQCNARNLTIKKYSRYLSGYPERVMSMSAYLNALRTMPDNPCNKYFIVYFNNVCEEKEGIIRNRPIYSRPAVEIPLPKQNVDTEQESGLLQTQLLQIPFISEQEEKSLFDSGCCEGEARTGVELMTHSFPGKQAMAGRTPAQHLRRMRHQNSQIAKNNQQLQHRWETMNLYDVATFIAVVSDIFNGRTDTSFVSAKLSPLECASFLATIFWTSCPVKEIRQIMLYSVSQEKTATKKGFVYQSEAPCHFLMRPARPTSRQPLTEEQQAQAVSIQQMLPLSIGLGVEKLIKTYIEKERGLPVDTPKPLFSKTGVIYYQVITTFVAAVNKRYNCRMTAGRLADHMFETITNHPGADLVCAMLITGRSHCLGETPLHYTALPVSFLQRIYCEVCSKIADLVEKELDIKDAGLLSRTVDVKKDSSADKNYIGSHYLPVREVVHNLILKVQKSHATANKAASSLNKILRLHNNLTLYSCLMIGYATGFRAVREPFLIGSQIDRATGLALLSDKDCGDYYNARLVWLPPFCLHQFDLYHSHLEHLNDRLFFLNPILFKKVHGFNRATSKMSNIPLLFFLENDRNDTEVRPAVLEKVLSKLFKLPVNANRHYLRSTLIAKGCPHTVVNAYLGHWERGQEPFGKFSALSPIVYRDSLMQYLMPILEKDGWKNLPGLGGKL